MPEGCAQNLGSPTLGVWKQGGACSGGLARGARGAQLGWALGWHRDGASGIDRGGGVGESGQESGKWSFLARIEREGRVPELMLPPPLVVFSLVGRVEVGSGGGGLQPGECSILHWPGLRGGYEAWAG